eukprot:2103027-Pleurochrysis_carterae.AAC.1
MFRTSTAEVSVTAGVEAKNFRSKQEPSPNWKGERSAEGGSMAKCDLPLCTLSFFKSGFFSGSSGSIDRMEIWSFIESVAKWNLVAE